MKNTKFYIITFIILIGCSKEEECDNGVSCLPPETQTGAQTFACLIDGKPFIEEGNNFNCYYQYLNGGYYFSISGEDLKNSIIQVIIATNDHEIKENTEYQLINNAPGNLYAEVNFSGGGEVETTPEKPGSLKILKFDMQSRIVSGIFSFEVINPNNGKIVSITNGRFDTYFTR